MSASGQQHDHLVLVVHGVGDPKPGETVDLFARSLADPDAPLESHGTVHWLEEPRGEPRNRNCFPVHTHRLLRGDQSAYLSEVFWGDISHVRAGRFGLFQGLLAVLFGLRFVAHQAASQRGWAARMLRWTGDRCADLLEAPLAAVNVIMAVLMIVGVALLRFAEPVYNNWQFANWIVMGTALLTLGIAVMRAWRTVGPRFRGFYWWVGFWAFDLALLAGYQIGWPHKLATTSVILWHAEIVIHVLEMVWLLLTLMVASMFLWWGLARWRPGNWPRGIDAGLLLPALTVGFWGQMFPTLWLLGYQVSIQLVGQRKELQDLFDLAVPLYRLQWLMASVLLGVAAISAGRLVLWSRLHNSANYRKSRPAPRLIVHRTIQIVTVLASMIGISVILYLAAYRVIMPYVRWEDTPIGPWLAWGGEFALVVTVLIGFAVIYFPPYIRIGVDIVFDVVTHFYQELNEETDEVRYVYREAIQDRFKATMELLCGQARPDCDLTVVAHSQGTIVAVEALRDPDNAKMFQRFRSVTFVTMGSPFRHLYQHYFSNLYPSLDHAHWSYFRNHVSRWINIFRIDDFVGTFIYDEDVPERHFGKLTVKDVPVDPKGHTNYWNDRQVLAELHRHKIVWNDGVETIPMATVAKSA